MGCSRLVDYRTWWSPSKLSRLDRHLQHPIPLVRKQLVGGHNVVELELVSYHQTQVDAARGYDVHKPTHALFAARAQRGDDAVVAQAGSEGRQGDGEVTRINTKLDRVRRASVRRRADSNVDCVPSASMDESVPALQ